MKRQKAFKGPASCRQDADVPTNLERNFHGELNLPRRKRASDCAESGTVDVRVSGLEIRVIEQIKKLGAKFKAR